MVESAGQPIRTGAGLRASERSMPATLRATRRWMFMCPPKNRYIPSGAERSGGD